MLNKIIIVDFEDSFTYNIASVLYEYVQEKIAIEVVTSCEFFLSQKINSLIDSSSIGKLGIILGPGPGHPKDQEKYFSIISKLLEQEHIFLMGICLGHQILGLIHHYKIDYCDRPIHGESVEFIFEERRYSVQKYNSLCVKKEEQIFDILQGERWISYQFHPESIGTTNNIDFFKRLLTFLD